jgi:hypothetical protein
MPAGSTYTPIATTTLGSAAATVTFSSIPSTYTDLVLVFNGTTVTTANNLSLQFNGDTASNYSMTRLRGNGTTASSTRFTSQTLMLGPNISSTSTTISPVIWQIQNYANITTYKTALARGGGSDVETTAVVGLWRNTTSINQVVVLVNGSQNIASGATLTLYGISAA